MYLFQTNAEFSDEQLRQVAAALHTKIGVVGKVKDEEHYHYNIFKEDLNTEDIQFISLSGLEILTWANGYSSKVEDIANEVARKKDPLYARKPQWPGMNL